jgi:hypothetical protein
MKLRSSRQMYLRMGVFLLCVIKYRIRMNKEQEEVLGIFICYAYPVQTISFDISSRLNV